MTKHNLYKTGDFDVPACITDANGEVVLSLCRDCGRGEVELEVPCVETLDEQQKAIKDKVAAAVEAGFDDKLIAQINKKLHDAYCDIQGSIEWELKSNIASNLASHISDYAQRTIEAILAGNEDETRRYLQCTLGPYSYNGRGASNMDWPFRLSSGPIELRRKLVEAFAELLKTERMLDLEAIVKAREKQIADLHEQVDKLKERLQYYDSHQAT